jgi:hypothetical protein
MFGHTIGDVDLYDFATAAWSVHPEPLPIETAAGGTGVVNNKSIMSVASLGAWKSIKRCRYLTPPQGLGRLAHH